MGERNDDRAVEDELARRLEAHPEISFALLFGSRAAGGARASSDWDVAYQVTPSLDERCRFDLRLALHAELDDLGRIDLVPLNDAPPLLAHRALQGRRLFVRDEVAYVRFFVRTLAASNDEAYFRAIHTRAMERRLAEGRFGRP